MEFITGKHLARRTFLRGLGATVALPLLDAMIPAATALVTPWSDIRHVGDSFDSNNGRDPVITWKRQLDDAARVYVRGADARSPAISPVFGDFGPGFPPTMITTGTRDLFLSHSVRLYWALRDAGVPVELRVWEGMWHSFQSAPAIPEAIACRAEVAAFLTGALAAAG